MYHLDQQEWQNHKVQIITHIKVRSELIKKVISQPMTGYQVLSKDRKVQMTCCGNRLKCVANYGNQSFIYGKIEIHAHSVLMVDGKVSKIYTPHS
jgi:hypothetical protein